MKPGLFTFSRPPTLAGAVAAMGEEGTMAIGGGQSLVPMLALRVAAAERLVDVGRLPELQGATVTGGALRLGASTTHAAIEDGAVPDVTRGLMAKVAGGIAYRAVRNFGTIGGSVALADPAADWPVCLIALDATLHVSGPRSTAIRGFITGPFATGLQPGEIITAIEIPALAPTARWGVSKLARKTGAFASSLAVCVIDGDIVTLALGGAVRFACLLDAADIEASVAAADPDGDDYERHCHVVTARRAIAQARAS